MLKRRKRPEGAIVIGTPILRPLLRDMTLTHAYSFTTVKGDAWTPRRARGVASMLH